MRSVLLDTSAIYALVVSRDQHHSAARAYLTRALDQRVRLVLSDAIFAETMNLLKSRHGAMAAITAGRMMKRSSAYLWEPLTAAGERTTWDIFQKHDDKAWSFTDCSLLAMAQRLHVAEVFSFDTHFDQMPGLTRVPGS